MLMLQSHIPALRIVSATHILSRQISLTRIRTRSDNCQVFAPCFVVVVHQVIDLSGGKQASPFKLWTNRRLPLSLAGTPRPLHYIDCDPAEYRRVQNRRAPDAHSENAPASSHRSIAVDRPQ